MKVNKTQEAYDELDALIDLYCNTLKKSKLLKKKA